MTTYLVGHYSNFDHRNKPRTTEEVPWPDLASARTAFDLGKAELVMLFRVRGVQRMVLATKSAPRADD